MFIVKVRFLKKCYIYIYIYKMSHDQGNVMYHCLLHGSYVNMFGFGKGSVLCFFFIIIMQGCLLFFFFFFFLMHVQVALYSP